MELKADFFDRDCLEVAPELVGKLLVMRQADGGCRQLRITETEAYRGEEDTACHAHKGRTKRSEVLYMAPGTIYVYLCYGVHWLLNLITAAEGVPQGVLIRACADFPGPGKLTRELGITGELNRMPLHDSPLSIVDDGCRPALDRLPRVGIGYASAEDQARLWRFAAIKTKST